MNAHSLFGAMKLVIGNLYVMSARSNVAEKLLPKDVVFFYNK